MKRFLFLLTLLVLLFPVGCSDDEGQIAVKTPIGEQTDIYGVVTDSNGQRLQGVVVSDGFTCAATDENGVYQLTRNANAYHVFLSIPEAFEVPMSEGAPCFWQQLSAQKRYDFTLRPLPGGPEQDFRLFCIADPQCQTLTHIARFTAETVPDIAAQAAASELPCYGITLGDIIWNSATKDVVNLMPRMKIALSQANTNLPVFQVMGNHDNAMIAVKKADYTVEHDIEAQRFFEHKFGPVNYSFNRGSAHIVAMDDIIFPNHDDYSTGFRDDQVEWLRQDLSFVPKDKMVILCVHIPLRNSASAKNVQAVLGLLDGYAQVHVMSGHTHYAENNIYADKPVYEHIHGAACGAWWYSTVNTDGTPNGYAIYDITGAGIERWHYKSTDLAEDYQIRLYRADEVFPGPYRFSYTASDQIVANIWNADADWTIEVLENGQRTGTMQPFATSTRRDAWASGYHCGVLGRGTNYDRTNNSHLYYYTLADPGASVEVRATDPFGRTYTQSVFTTAAEADYPAIN